MIENHESITAKICSFVRAYHSAYAQNKIFDDYLAYDLLGQNEYIRIGKLIENNFNQDKIKDNYSMFDTKKVGAIVDELLAPIPLSRLAFAYEKFEEFRKSHPKMQFLILGAGLDTFSFTNADENIQVYELDHPSTAEYKSKKILDLNWVIPKNLHFIKIDFQKQKLLDVLNSSKLDRNIPTFVTILGVAYYLELEVFTQTLKVISSFINANTQVLFDYPDETTKLQDSSSRVARLAAMTQNLGETMVDGFSLPDIEKALKSASFNLDEHLSPEAIDKKYFLNQPNLKAFENVHFISAKV